MSRRTRCSRSRKLHSERVQSASAKVPVACIGYQLNAIALPKNRRGAPGLASESWDPWNHAVLDDRLSLP